MSLGVAHAGWLVLGEEPLPIGRGLAPEPADLEVIDNHVGDPGEDVQAALRAGKHHRLVWSIENVSAQAMKLPW
jgi:hypothetical protein